MSDNPGPNPQTRFQLRMRGQNGTMTGAPIRVMRPNQLSPVTTRMGMIQSFLPGNVEGEPARHQQHLSQKLPVTSHRENGALFIGQEWLAVALQH